MLYLHLVDVHEFDLALVGEVFEDLPQLLDTFLVYHHVLVGFTREDHGFHVGIGDDLASDVLEAEARKLKVRDTDLYLPLVCIETAKVVATGEQTMEESEVGIEDSHYEADVDDGVCVFATAVCLRQIVELEDKLGCIFKEEFEESHL
jgi:hypothetical protein